MSNRRPHGDVWPYSLPHDRRAGARRKMALALAGHYSLYNYFTTPFSEIVRPSREVLSGLIVRTNENCRVYLGSEEDFRTLMQELIDALVAEDDWTMQLLLERNVPSSVRDAADALEEQGISMHFKYVPDDADDPRGIKQQIQYLFARGVEGFDRPLLDVLGDMAIKDFHSVFDSDAEYDDEYPPGSEKRKLFQRMRDLGILSCYQGRDEATKRERAELVSGTCWNGKECREEDNYNCNGGPGPGTDECPP